jgi:Big-like domain-containing protein
VSSPSHTLVLPVRKRSLAVCLAAVLGAAGVAPGVGLPGPLGSIVVTNCDDSGPGSLRDAVQGNVSGVPIDLSQLSCSTITLTSGAIEATHSTRFFGPGSAALTIDGNHESAVLVESDASATLSIEGVTIENGYVVDGYGGCIFSAGSVVLDDAIVTGCQVAAHGVAQGQHFSSGGIEARGDFSATDSKIVGNSLNVSTAAAEGGGIRVTGNATLVNTTISGNSIDIIASMGQFFEIASGGGAFVEGSTLLINSSISNNTSYSVAGSRGAGIYALGTLSMAYSTLSTNSITASAFSDIGGGGYVAGSFYADHSTIFGNTAKLAGGIWANFIYSVRLEDSTVSGNIAQDMGGMLVHRFYAYNSTITANTGGSCGGVFVDDGSADLISTIVYGNSSSTPERANICGLVGIDGGHDIIGPTYVRYLPDDTLRADPLLGPLADNGGSTLTHALLPGSPAIDAGFASAAIAWDQRGEGYPRSVGGSVDIGAYEAPLADQAPIASDDGYTTSEDTELIVEAPGVLANDSDTDGDAVSAVLVDDVSNGVLTLEADGSLDYVPMPGFFGTDTFTYQVTDGVTNSNVATVTIQVQEVVDGDLVFGNGFD